MTIIDVFSLLRDASPLMYAVGAGWLLVKEHVILGAYHRNVVSDRDKIILDQSQKILQLEEDERKARELAWMATDIGRFVLDRVKEEKVPHAS